jgi:hypothetical protein
MHFATLNGDNMAQYQKKLSANLIVDLTDVLQRDPVAVGIGFDGALFAVAPVSAKYEKVRDYNVIRWEKDHIWNTTIHAPSLDIAIIQPFPGGILLAGSRCRWRPEDIEKNALIIDWNGKEISRFVLGDGIQDLRTTKHGTIWVSYYDEGVFGNYGWGRPGPQPIGKSGLVAFSPQGTMCFSYDHTAARTDVVCDAYALNVAGKDDIWLYFYTEFPIVRILNGSYYKWEFGVGGARALAVRKEQAFLVGDYKAPALGRIVELAPEGIAKITGEVLLLDDCEKLLDGACAWGIRDSIYFYKDRRFFVVNSW